MAAIITRKEIAQAFEAMPTQVSAFDQFVHWLKQVPPGVLNVPNSIGQLYNYHLAIVCGYSATGQKAIMTVEEIVAFNQILNSVRERIVLQCNVSARARNIAAVIHNASANTREQ